MRAHVIGHAVVLTLLLGAGWALADASEAYRKGITAAESGKWDDVERAMREAIAEKPRAGGSVKIYGMRFEDYLPHYYLGLALFHQGKCKEAIAAWQTSEKQAAIRKKDKLFSTLKRNRSQCETRLAAAATPTPRPATPTPPPATPTPAPATPTPPTPPPGPDPAAVAAAVRTAEAGIRRAEEAARAVAALSAVWSGDPRLGPAQRRAESRLSAATGLLSTGRAKPDLALLQRATENASTAERELRAIENEATRMARAQEATTAATPTPLARPSAGAPGELVAAVGAYFGGRYRETLSLLDGRRYEQAKAQTQALLFRGAARFALYALGGETDQGLLGAAREDLSQAHRLDPRLSPDRRVFSPRFLELFATCR